MCIRRGRRIVAGLLLAIGLAVAPSAASAQGGGATPAVSAPGTSVAPVPPSAAAEANRELSRSERPSGVDDAGPESEGLGWTLVKMLVTLGVVVLLVYLTLNVGLRKMMGIAPSGQRQSVVKVIERISIDPKRTLVVVKAAGEYLLLGGAEQSLNLLCKLDTAEVERIEKDRQGEPGSPALTPFLQKLLARRGGPPPPSA